MKFSRFGTAAVLGLSLILPGAGVSAADTETDKRIIELEVVVRELLDRIEVMNSRIRELEKSESETMARFRRFEMGLAAPDEAEPESPSVSVVDRSDPRKIGELYQAAVVLQANGRYDEAIDALTEVYEADPDGELADNALFWMGETHFARGEYPLAVKLYERVVADYADENKAPDALLRVSRAYGRMGDLIQARKVIDRLIQEYPYSTAAVSGRAERESYRY